MHVILWFAFVYVFSNNVRNGFNRFISPAVKGDMGQANPNRDCIRYIHFWVEVRGPYVQVKTSRIHEVGTISEDEIPIFFDFKEESIVTPSTESYGDFSLDVRIPVALHPFLNSSGRGPQASKLSN